MFVYHSASLNEEEAQMFWDYVRTGHVAQDPCFNGVVEKIEALVPDGMAVFEIQLKCRATDPLVENDNTNQEETTNG